MATDEDLARRMCCVWKREYAFT